MLDKKYSFFSFNLTLKKDDITGLNTLILTIDNIEKIIPILKT